MGKRITVIGNAGGGKTRLAKGLARQRALPLCQLDHLQWQPGWVATPEVEFRRSHDAFVAASAWIVDGVASWASVLYRLERCDTVVYVNLPFRTHLWWATKRQVLCLFRPRPDFVPGCPMLPMTGRLHKLMWSLHRRMRPLLSELVELYRRDKNVYVLRTAKEVDQFYRRYCS